MTDAPTAHGNTIQDNVSTIVRMLMGMRGINQTQLGEAIMLGQSAVSDKISHRRRWTLDDVQLLADFFDISPGVFFDDPEALFRTGSFTTLVGLPATLTPELPFPPAGRQLAAVGQG